MGILNIREAVREGARVVVGIAGVSGSGKTYTALQLAWGLAGGDSRKVGLLDTENKRGSLYSDILVGRDKQVNPFMIGDLYAPFSPQRYSQAIKEFQQAGVEVLVVDSVSHEWEGEGGCEDIADDGGKIANWKKAKREHKRFMNTLLTCDMHIIVCLRAREKTSFVDPKKPVSLGIQPIQEKNFMFELTTSIMIHDQGTRWDVLKCPEALQAIFYKEGGYLGAREGLALRKWIDGGQKLNPAIERAKNTILSMTGEGLDSVNDEWESLPEGVREQIGEKFIESARASAQEFDRIAAERSANRGDDLDLSGGGFNPMERAESEQVSAPTTTEQAPPATDDPFAS